MADPYVFPTYSIIKNHHGYITAESEVGVGTKFTLYLPASQGQAVSETREAKILSGHGKILVMDDEVMIQDITRAMLNKLGYEVEVAGSGDEAVEMFRSARESGRPFDAVLMDLTIPGGMGGKEAVQHIATIDEGVKAIVSSGYSNDPIMSQYRNYGFSGMVTKPYDFQKLSSVLHQVLQER